MNRARTGIALAATLLGVTGLGCERSGPAPVAAPALPADARLTVRANGIGPFILGRPLREAAGEAINLDPAAANIGPGCDARDQVTVSLNAGTLSFTVMSMAAADGRIEELTAIPDGLPPAAAQADECRAAGAAFALALDDTLGTPAPAAPTNKAVSTEYAFVYAGGSRVIARWFEGGRSCDLALHFAAPDTP